MYNNGDGTTTIMTQQQRDNNENRGRWMETPPDRGGGKRKAACDSDVPEKARKIQKTFDRTASGVEKARVSS